MAAAANRYSAESLENAAAGLLRSFGAHEEVAADVARSCIRSSLRGIDSHGLALLPKIIDRVINKDAGKESADKEAVRTQLSEPAVVVVGDADMPVAVVDARISPGQHACLSAARLATEKARRFGIAMVAVRNSTHFGAATPYLQEILAAGFVGMVGSNCTPSMAGCGSPVANMGNMPWGFGAPVAGAPDFIFDFCCAVMSFGKLNRLKAAGEPIPEGAFKAVEVDVSTTDRAFTNAAALSNLGLPFGGYKGSAVAMMIEVLSGCLSAGNFGADAECVKDGKFQGPSHFVLAINPSKFGGADGDFVEGMKKYVDDIKAPSPGEIRYSGENGAATHAERSVKGIPVAEALEKDLQSLAAQVSYELVLKPVDAPAAAA